MEVHSAQLSDERPWAAEAALCLSRRFVALDARILAADLSPENRSWLAARHPGLPIARVTRACLMQHLGRRFGAALLEEAVSGLALRHPRLSASRVITNPQAACLLWGGLLLGLGFVLAPLASLRVMIGLLSLMFVAGGLFRAGWALLGSRPAPAPSPTHVALPRYTILVPLYREAAVLPALARALAAIDYPPQRLQILLAVEADDKETLRAALSQPGCTVVKVPPGAPRTKPKAANYALQFARGEYLVVYDAEDRPEPDQLLKAVAAFRGHPRAVACLQARLNFFNAGRNWLTNGIMAQTPQEI